MAIESTQIHAMDSGVSGKGKVASGELRLSFFFDVGFCVCEVVKRKQHKSLLLDERSFNIKQQVAFFCCQKGRIS